MMKKQFFLTLLAFLLGFSSFARADFYDFYMGAYMSTPSSAQMDDYMKEFGKAVPQILHGGMGQTLFDENFPLALGFSVTRFDKEGALQKSSDGLALNQIIATGYSFGNLDLIARFGGSPSQKGFLFGNLALAYRFNLDFTGIKGFYLRPLVMVAGGGLNLEEAISASAQVQGVLDFEGVLFFVSGGASFSKFKARLSYKANLVYGETFYEIQPLQPHVSAGVRVAWLYYEWAVLPVQSHSLGLTFYF